MPHDEHRLTAVKDLRNWLNENRPVYLEMKKRLDSPKATRQMLLNLRAVCEPILAYSPMNDPHVAVFIVAEAKTNLQGFFQDLEFAEHYEEKLQEIKELKEYEGYSDEDEEL